MRKARPFNRPRPAPRDRLNRSRAKRAEPIRIVAVGHHHGGDDSAVFVGPLACDLQCPSAGWRRVRPRRAAGVPRKHLSQPFLVQHPQRFAQSRTADWWRAWRERTRPHWRRASAPRPSTIRGSRAVCEAASALSLIAVEAQTGRQHQSLLRPGQRDVDAPFVVPQIDRGQRRHRVDEQQRRDGRRDRSPARISASRLVAPVDVSLWTTSSARICWDRSALSRSSTVRRIDPPPPVAGMTSTSRPSRRPPRPRAARTHRCRTTSTRSPGDRVLTSAASQRTAAGGGKNHHRPPRLEHPLSVRRALRGRARRTRGPGDRSSAAPSPAARDRGRWSDPGPGESGGHSSGDCNPKRRRAEGRRGGRVVDTIAEGAEFRGGRN